MPKKIVAEGYPYKYAALTTSAIRLPNNQRSLDDFATISTPARNHVHYNSGRMF